MGGKIDTNFGYCSFCLQTDSFFVQPRVSGFIGKVPVTWLPGWDGTEAPELYQKKTFPLFCAPASCLVIPFVCIHFYECFRKNLLLAKKGRRALSLRKTNSQMQIAEDSSPSARILCKFIHKTMIIPLKMQTKVFLLCSLSRSATEKLRDIKSLCNGCRLRWSRVGGLLGRAWIFFQLQQNGFGWTSNKKYWKICPFGVALSSLV